MLQDLARDLRHAVRLLRRAPGFTLLAGLTLAVATGANTAIFSVVNSVLLRPLPYYAADRLTFLDAERLGPDGSTDFQLSYPDFADLAAASQTLSAAAPWSNGWGLGLERPDGAVRLQANFVGAGDFNVLGVHAALGRTFTADEHAIAGGPLVAILADAVRRQHFGADPELSAVRCASRDVRSPSSV